MSEEQAPSDAAPKKKSDLGPRVLTAVLMIPVILWMVLAGPHWVWGGFIISAAFAGLYEFNAMLQQSESKDVRVVSSVIATAFVLVVYLFIGARPVIDVGAHQGLVLFGTLAGMSWLAFLYNLMRKRNISTVAVTIAAPLAGVLYAGVGFAMLAIMKRDFGDDGPGWIMMSLAPIWASDTGAYFAGRAFGKHKLAPIVSPKKTVEGAIGGLLGTIVAAYAIKFLMLDFLSIADVLIIALVANFLGQTGDLCESLIKRSVGVKDSGTIIHGHGGMLDRVDAVIFAAPWVFLYASLAGGSALIG